MVYGPGIKPTLLGLARYGELMLMRQPHLHQLEGAKAPLSSGCDSLWDQPAREALIRAIQNAEKMIAQQLGFWPAPKYITDEYVRVEARSDWFNAEFQTKWKHVQAFGTEALSLAGADVPVTYTDEDHDPKGREETATITSLLYSDLTACTEECDVAVFFRTEDGAKDDAHADFEIRNLYADIDGASMHLWGESSMFIIPTHWNLTEAECYGEDDWEWPFDTTNLVSRVDVYCRSTNAVLPATLYWDGICDCTSPCSHSTQTACVQVTDWDSGHFMVRPATWNGSAHVYSSPNYAQPPQKIKINYLAGYPLEDCRMDETLARAVIKLANVLLPEPPCSYCEQARLRWENDRKPIDPLTPEAASLPWDIYCQGALEAWRIVKQFSLNVGKVKMGW